jgi:hypothetical protein
VGMDLIKIEEVKIKYDKNFIPGNKLIKETKRKSTFITIHPKNLSITSSVKVKVLEKRIQLAINRPDYHILC